MRLSVNLEEPYYRAAKALAKAEDCSLSAAVNRLVRAGFERLDQRRAPSPRAGMPFPVSRGARPITSEMVDNIDQHGE